MNFWGWLTQHVRFSGFEYFADPGAVAVVRFPSELTRRVLYEGLKRNGIQAPEQFLSLRRRAGDEIFLPPGRMQKRPTAALLKRLARRREVAFIPVSLFAGHGPKPLPLVIRIPFDSRYLPLGELWSLVIALVYRRAMTLEVGPIIRPEKLHSGNTILNALSRALYRKEKLARGPRENRGDIIERIVLSGERFESVLSEVSDARSAPRAEVYRQSQRIFREVAAKMRGTVIGFFRILLNWSFRRLFDGVQAHGVEELRHALGSGPVVLLPNHRSHADYLLLSYVLFHNRLPLPYIAAGDNLNFFPVGPLLRASGGFFIRRKIDNDRLYKVILDRYLTYLLKQGHPIEFFIEGGRSRSGFTLKPRVGLLKYIIRSILGGSRQDVAFIPVQITYEQVPEERALLRELAGEKKKRESIFDLVKLGRLLEKNFGSVTVTFGPGISLREMTRDGGSSALTSVLAYRASRETLRLSPISLTSLCMTALSLDEAPTKAELAGRMESLLGILRRLHPRLAVTPYLGRFENDLEGAIDFLSTRGVIAPEAPWVSSTSRREYYRNLTLHLFAPALGAAFRRHTASASHAAETFYLLYEDLFLLEGAREVEREIRRAEEVLKDTCVDDLLHLTRDYLLAVEAQLRDRPTPQGISAATEAFARHAAERLADPSIADTLKRCLTH